ncbi:thiopeptide-type bacteriocin biosynthesis protein [Amycolatopsis aidingensis]|uniref:thiopeptide-type bacteriocin biosynthesis protein n=1 Tax=Amycolatopsis aidingensis TaxID=2842453 RepID=UPI001C0B52DA|nr:thiopeptide-type bacteriocin biosynthesis protein [Amycolatopsis aidingensis]
MPAHHLATPAASTGAPPDVLASAVHSVLAGTPPAEACTRHGLTDHDLDDAVETYCQAGSTALYDRAADAGWWQAHLEFADWRHAEHLASTVLEPHLRDWHANGLLEAWWFIRKAPCWRLRLRPANSTNALPPTAGALFDQLVDSGHLRHWQPTHYEPETLAFGGPTGISIAHRLFSADSANLLHYLGHIEPPLGRRELSLLLCTTLLRAAGLEWFETGDVWHRVTCLRTNPDHPSTAHGHHATLTHQLHTLLTYDTRPTGPIFGPNAPAATLRPWAEAFHHAGHALATAAHHATLHRGLRAVLAHHVIFHWNRLGLHTTTQHALAHAATTAIHHHEHGTQA